MTVGLLLAPTIISWLLFKVSRLPECEPDGSLDHLLQDAAPLFRQFQLRHSAHPGLRLDRAGPVNKTGHVTEVFPHMLLSDPPN